MQPSWKIWFTVWAVTAAAVFVHADVARADSPEATFYRAYYLEQEQGDIEAAAKLYDEVVNAEGVTEELKARAQARLARCQEAIAAEDFARLMPIGTLVYVEVNNPGDQVHRLAEMLGLMGPDVESQDPEAAALAQGKHVAISPTLIRELLGIRGFAVAVTGFDPVSKMPSAVAVFDPGNVDVIRGIIETALPAAAEPVEPIEGFKTYNVEDKVFVCLTARMVIVSPQRGNIASVVRKLKEPWQKSCNIARTPPSSSASTPSRSCRFWWGWRAFRASSPWLRRSWTSTAFSGSPGGRALTTMEFPSTWRWAWTPGTTTCSAMRSVRRRSQPIS
jgi:hypothetical protein